MEIPHQKTLRTYTTNSLIKETMVTRGSIRLNNVVYSKIFSKEDGFIKGHHIEKDGVEVSIAILVTVRCHSQRLPGKNCL